MVCTRHAVGSRLESFRTVIYILTDTDIPPAGFRPLLRKHAENEAILHNGTEKVEAKLDEIVAFGNRLGLRDASNLGDTILGCLQSNEAR